MLTSPSLPIDSIIFDLALVSANLACYKISFHSEKYSEALRVSYTQVAAPLGFISAHAGKQTVHLMFLRWVSSAGGFISSLNLRIFPPFLFLWGGSKWGSFRDECERLPKRYCIFTPVHRPERNADPVKPVCFFSNACMRHRRRLLHFSDHIQEWPKLDPDEGEQWSSAHSAAALIQLTHNDTRR